MRDVLVTSNRRCASVVKGERYLLPQATEDGPWEIHVGEPITGGVLRQNQDFLLVNLSSRRKVLEKGIYVGSWSPHNWYHWTIDVLPSVWLTSQLASHYSSFPILVPESPPKGAAGRELFEIASGGRPTVPLPSNRFQRVKELIWMDSPTTPGPRAIAGLKKPNFRIHKNALNAFREHVIAALGLNEDNFSPHRKIFIIRNEFGNRPYNQRELVEVSKKYGFEPILLEELSLKESVELMLETSHLLGAHGAGWATALFCQENIEGFMWSWESSLHDNWFANIGALREMNLRITLNTTFTESGHYLNPEELEAYLYQSVLGPEH